MFLKNGFKKKVLVKKPKGFSKVSEAISVCLLNSFPALGGKYSWLNRSILPNLLPWWGQGLTLLHCQVRLMTSDCILEASLLLPSRLSAPKVKMVLSHRSVQVSTPGPRPHSSHLSPPGLPRLICPLLPVTVILLPSKAHVLVASRDKKANKTFAHKKPEGRDNSCALTMCGPLGSHFHAVFILSAILPATF